MSSYATALRTKDLTQQDEAADSSVRADRTDMQVVGLILAGEEFAFEILFERYKRLVAGVAGRYFQRPEQVDEVVQVSFTKAYFQLSAFRGSHDLSLVSWLGKITTNTCLDLLRNQKRKPENMTCELSDAERRDLQNTTRPNDGNAERSLISRDLAEKLLANLAPEDRSVMQMLYADQMSVDEAAEILGWSKSKTKMRAWRARNALRSILKRFL